MSSKQNTPVKIYFAKQFFYLGEYIKGSIRLDTTSSITIAGVLIQIFKCERWKTNGTSDECKKLIVNYDLDLTQLKNFKRHNNEIVLRNGSNYIPFNFRFSEDNVPSFEFPHQRNKAFVRYSFNVNINSRHLSRSIRNSSFLLCLLSRPVIDPDKLLTIEENKNITKWGMINKGNIGFKVSIPGNNFKYDSKCQMDIEIDNTNGKVAVNNYKVVLRRFIEFKNKVGEVKSTDKIKIVSESVKAKVEPGSKKHFKYNLILKENDTEKKYKYESGIIPYRINMSKIDFFMQTIKGEIISCRYEIKVTLYNDMFAKSKNRPQIIIPIYIVHQLPIEYQLEIQQMIELEKIMRKSFLQHNRKKENINNNNMEEHKKNRNEKRILDQNFLDNNIKEFDLNIVNEENLEYSNDEECQSLNDNDQSAPLPKFGINNHS